MLTPETMLSDCQARFHLLTHWDKEFVNFVDERLKSNLTLTPDQINALKRVWSYAVNESRP